MYTAALTNRVLEVVWEANKNCGATYNDLFTSKSQVHANCCSVLFCFVILLFSKRKSMI